MTFMAGKRPTAASVIALAAVICAMSGGAVAASGVRQNGDKLIAKHTLSGNRLRNGTLTAHQIKQPVWHTMTLENGWAAFDTANYGAPEYAVDAQGFVRLRGAIKDVSATSGTFTQLPAGYRPAEVNVFLPAASTNGSGGPQDVVLDVQHTGFVTAEVTTGGSLGFVSLGGVTFAR
jgi:predicted small integral membrane protein